MGSSSFEKRTPEQNAASEEEALQDSEIDWNQTRRDIDAKRIANRLPQFQPHDGLKKLRDELQYSQAKMAEISGVSRRTYQSYESGENPIPSNVISLLGATLLFDIHRLFTGRSHTDNLQVRTESAKLAADVILHLKEEFSEMEPHEMQRIAMEFARSNKLGTPITRGTVYSSIRIATGSTYIADETPFSEVGELEPDDFPPDAT